MDRNKILERFFKFCKRANFKQAIFLTLPSQIGAPLAELMFGNDLQEVLTHFFEQSETLQEKTINILEKIIETKYKGIKKLIIVIGSANAETIFYSEEEITIGNKYRAEFKNLLGGSGVNFSLRLLAAGYPVMPVLPLGNSNGDTVGIGIQERIINTAKRGGVYEKIENFLNSPIFFNSNIKTPTSGIFISGTDRTILKQDLEGEKFFHQHLEKQLEHIYRNSNDEPGAVMIGHIQSDQQNGESTKKIIDTYRNRTLIYTVFGNSQIKHNYKFWEENGFLKYVDVFQLNMTEAKEFFSDNGSKKSLLEILDWFRNKNITAIITLDKYGAIGTYKDLEYVFVAWPLIGADEVIDSTGAGDAFAAGMVSFLTNKKKFTETDFREAMQIARIWASCACTQIGGSGEKPDDELENFVQKHPGCDRKIVEVKNLNDSQELMTFIDLTYQ